MDIPPEASTSTRQRTLSPIFSPGAPIQQQAPPSDDFSYADPADVAPLNDFDNDMDVAPLDNQFELDVAASPEVSPSSSLYVICILIFNIDVRC